MARGLRQVTLQQVAGFPRSGKDRFSILIPVLISSGAGVLKILFGGESGAFCHSLQGKVEPILVCFGILVIPWDLARRPWL